MDLRAQSMLLLRGTENDIGIVTHPALSFFWSAFVAVAACNYTAWDYHFSAAIATATANFITVSVTITFSAGFLTTILAVLCSVLLSMFSTFASSDFSHDAIVVLSASIPAGFFTWHATHMAAEAARMDAEAFESSGGGARAMIRAFDARGRWAE